MQIVISFDESSRILKLQAPIGTSPLLLTMILSQSITAMTDPKRGDAYAKIALAAESITKLAAPMVGGGQDLIVPAQGMSGLKTT